MDAGCVGASRWSWGPGYQTKIGEKDLQVAAKTLALSLADLCSDPKLVAEARAEFDRRRAGRTWPSRTGDRPPPLDQRK